MSQIIHLLPDNIANQIAAGEVVQRPASAVKELMENAIDAGADEINLIVKEGGKTLIQVIDNGKGMSEIDGRMAFERHATSKIKNSEDLFSINTMGFRGEALASIAAISHVELVTREKDADVATRILIKGSVLDKQDFTQAPIGTSISIKNLFYNVPARRKFLKTDATEYKHLVDEFHHVALAYPGIKWKLFHNGNEIYHLPKGNLRQRIVNLFGKSMNERLVPVEQQTEIIDISGFVVKPKFAKKSRSEQYLFVNNRFIKSPYMNHAIRYAFENLLSADYHPGFFINLTIDPTKIDVNVHPTKQEIKFEEERLIYNYLKVAVRHALGANNLTPMLDFDNSSHFLSKKQDQDFDNREFIKQRDENLKNWELLYDGMIEVETDDESQDDMLLTIPSKISSGNSDNLFSETPEDRILFQIHNRYIISPISSGFIMIDQIAAHERIIYEEHTRGQQSNRVSSQTLMFPHTLDFSPGKSELLQSMLPSINKMGFEIQYFGQNSFLVHAMPAHLPPDTDLDKVVYGIVEDISSNVSTPDLEEEIIKLMSLKMSMSKAQKLNNEELQNLVDRLFACEHPNMSPSNKNIIVQVTLDDIQNMFKIKK